MDQKTWGGKREKDNKEQSKNKEALKRERGYKMELQQVSKGEWMEKKRMRLNMQEE